MIIGRLSNTFCRNSGASRKIIIRCNPPHSEGDCSGSAFIFTALNLSLTDEYIISGWIDTTTSLMALLISKPAKRSCRYVNDKSPIGSDLPEGFSSPDLIYIGSIGRNESISAVCANFTAAPLIFGPVCRNNACAEEIRALGGGFIIDNAAEFSRLANRLQRDPEERRIRAKWISEYLEEAANSEQETGNRGLGIGDWNPYERLEM